MKFFLQYFHGKFNIELKINHSQSYKFKNIVLKKIKNQTHKNDQNQMKSL